MEPRTITESRVKIAGYLLLLAGMLALGAYVVKHSHTQSEVCLGWFCVVFFVLGMAAVAWRLIRPQTLRLDADGFTLAGGILRRPHRFFWRDVDRFFLVGTGTKIAAFKYKLGHVPPGLLESLNRTIGVDGTLQRGWTLPSKDLVNLLNTYRERARDA